MNKGKIFGACAMLACCLGGATAQERPRAVLQRTSDPVSSPAASATGTRPPNTSLATARVIFIYPRSPGIDASDVEAELLNVKKFRNLGLQITRDPDKADVVLEVTQGDDTVTVMYSAIDIQTKAVLAAGKATNIFGFATQMAAKDFVGKVEKARSNP